MPILNSKIRSDLTYHADPEQPGHFYVKDPIRREYFHFNALQVAMMRALDGRRDIDDIVEILGCEFGVEVPPPKITSFIARLQRELLLDVGSYTVDDAKTRRAIVRELRKRNLLLRATPRDDTSDEGRQFSQGIRKIRSGDPCHAASYFQAVLEINPQNQRAASVLLCIHEAFFRSRRRTPSHLVMFHLWNPDRFLTMVDRWIGRFVYSRVGAVIIGALILSAAYPMIDVLSRPAVLSSISFGDLFVFEVTFLLGLLVHELGHGLSCKHYGGTVDDLGVMIFYGAFFAAYCDASDTYVFSSRRHKVTVFLSGVISHSVYAAILWHLLALADPSIVIWNGVLMALMFLFVSSFINLIPLAQLDGYYALSDYLGIRNLRQRSFRYLLGRLSKRLFGVILPEEEPTRRERTIFAAFGVMAAAYSFSLVYLGWISVILPAAVKYLGVLGVLVAAVFFARLLGGVISSAGLRFARFLVAERRVIFTRRRSLCFAIAIFVGVGLLSAPWPVHVDGEVVIEPQRRVTVRAEEPGLILELRVEDGDLVSEGEVIAILRSDRLALDHTLTEQDLAIARLELARLERGVTREELAVVASKSSSERVASKVARSRLTDERQLLELGVTPGATFEQARGRAAVAQESARASGLDEALTRAGARSEDSMAAEATVRESSARLRELAMRVGRLEIRASISGVVVRPRLRERLGQWLGTGDELCEIHDVSSWRAVITPRPGDPLGALEVGQPVVLHVAGDPHNQVDAKLEKILAPPSKRSVPKLETSVPNAGHWRAGMTGHARVYGRRRSIAYRLVAVPIIRIIDFDLWRLIWG